MEVPVIALSVRGLVPDREHNRMGDVNLRTKVEERLGIDMTTLGGAFLPPVDGESHYSLL